MPPTQEFVLNINSFGNCSRRIQRVLSVAAFMFNMKEHGRMHRWGVARVLTDNELIRQADRGDAKAFAALVQRHYQRIFKYAWQSLRNRADAEDIAQDVCVKLWTKLEGFDRDSNFVAWLYAITLNTIRSHLRKPDSKATTDDLDDWSNSLTDDAAISPERRAMAKQTLVKMMKLLSPREREAVLLVYAEGLTHAEAAIAMECSESTVSGFIHTAKRKFVDDALSEVGLSQ